MCVCVCVCDSEVVFCTDVAEAPDEIVHTYRVFLCMSTCAFLHLCTRAYVRVCVCVCVCVPCVFIFLNDFLIQGQQEPAFISISLVAGQTKRICGRGTEPEEDSAIKALVHLRLHLLLLPHSYSSSLGVKRSPPLGR